MPPKARTPSLQEAIKAAQKKYGIRIGSLDSAAVKIEAFPTGISTLDFITGVGGLPRGRLVELYGPPSSGKTTTALMAAAAAQRRGHNVAFFDHEQAIDRDYCETLGLDCDADSFVYCAPDYLEQGVNIARALAETGEVAVVIFDSVAGMIPEKELSSETGKSSFALQAKSMSQACKQIVPLAASTGTLFIFLNHVQEVLDATPMGQKLAAAGVQRKTTPGGKALKYYASVRIEFKPIGGIRERVHNELSNEDEDVVNQQKVEVTVVKNKVGPPFRHTELRTVFGRGFSRAHAALKIVTANKLGISSESSGVYRFKDATLAPKGMDVSSKNNWMRGETTIINAIDADPEWLTRVEAAAQAHIEKITSSSQLIDEADLPAIGETATLEEPKEGESTEPPEEESDAPDDIDALLST